MKQRLLFLLTIFCLLTVWYSCVEEDLCEDIVCLNGGFCNSGTCDCPEGFSGFNCETAIVDPCENVICFNNGTCVDGTCICADGFTGVSCETAIVTDPCEGVSCFNGGNCVNGSCNCVNGYTGVNCETPPNVDPCANVTCFNGGVCNNGVCDCIDGYTGPNCEVAPADPCAGIVCSNGGVCNNGICDCINGYTGVNCEIPPTDPCANVTCENGGSCALDQNGNPICDCPNGYYGATCQLLECFLVDCPPNSTCVDDGLGSCNCNTGYEPGVVNEATGEEGCIASSMFWEGTYIGQEVCAIGGESPEYECTITVDEVDPTIIYLNNLGGFDFAVGAFVQEPTRIEIPQQEFDLGGFPFVIEGTTFGSQNNETGNIGVSYKFTCIGCAEDGGDLADECDAALIRQ